MSSGAFRLTDIEPPKRGKFSAGDVDKPLTYWEQVNAGLLQGMKDEGSPEAAIAGGKAALEVAGAEFGGLSGLRGIVGVLARVAGSGAGAAAGNAIAQGATTGKVDPAEAAKTGASFAGGQGLSELLGPGISALRSGLSKLFYTAKGELTPIANALVHPTELPETILRKAIPEPPTFPGASQPAAESFYEKKATDLMKREAQQRVLDARAAREAAQAAKNAPTPPPPSPFGNATASNAPNLPNTPATGFKALQVPDVKMVNKFEAPEPSVIQSPLSPPPPINKTLVSYNRDLLVHMAKGGDLNALRELIRNPGSIDVGTAVPNSKYLLEAGQPTNIYGGPQPPKAVTKFTASGEPIADANYAYRVRDVGEEGIKPSTGHAHATTDLGEAQSYVPGRESVQGNQQELVKFDLTKLKEGTDYVRVPRPGQPDWIRILRPVPESAILRHPVQ